MTLNIDGVLRFEADAHGLSRFVITNQFAEAEVYLLGGQVTAFRPIGQEPVLWLSPLSAFEEGKAIRGGVPICWPWFGPHPSRTDQPAHGLARTREWKPLDAGQLSDGRTRVRLTLADDELTRAAWPHGFDLTLSVTVGDALHLELITTNNGDGPLAYADALHTYLRVGDVRRVSVEGLHGKAFSHSTRHYRGVQSGPVTFDGDEVNNIYLPSRGAVRVIDPLLKRVIEVSKSGSLATVVWNPGAGGGEAMKDVRGEWDEFVCVEAGTCADARIVLLPGSSHSTGQTIGVSPMST